MRRRAISFIITMTGMALALSGCGIADSRTPLPLPDFMRAKAADPPPLEQPPDVRRMVRERLDQVFVTQSSPQKVQVSEEDYLNGWWIGNATYRDRTAGSESN